MKKELKKYAIACKKEEVKDVLKELHKAGFEGGPAPKDCILDVNFRGRGVINYGSNGVHDINWYVEQGTEFLTPSYVLTHAHELDGARRLEDTPPDGWKLVPDDMAHHMKNGDYMVFGIVAQNGWVRGYSVNIKWNAVHNRKYAVRDSYQFPKPWEIAPEGYRIVTEEEREKYDIPPSVDGTMRRGETDDLPWRQSRGPDGWELGSSRHDERIFAVPLDFTFEPEVVEMTMAEVCKLAGKRVKIVK